MKQQLTRYLGVFLAGCVVSAMGAFLTRGNSAPERFDLCEFSKKSLEERLESGWYINTTVQYEDTGPLFIVLAQITEGAKCPFDDDLTAFYMQNGGVFGLRSLVRISKFAKKGENPKTLALIEKLKKDL